MKKLFLTFVFIPAIATSFAQEKSDKFSKGNKVVSGMFSFSSTSKGDESKTDYVVSPRAGMFLSDNLLIGLSVGAGSSMSKSTSTKTADISKFNAGLFARYYTKPFSNFSLFGHAEAGFMNDDDKIGKVKTTDVNLTLSPGISYFLSNNFILEAMLGRIQYKSSQTDIPESKPTTSFGIDFNISQIQFGMMYKL